MRPVRAALALAFATLAPLGGLALATAPAGATETLQLAASSELNANGTVTLSYTITCPSGDSVEVTPTLMQQDKAVENKGGGVQFLTCTGSAQHETVTINPASGSTFRPGWAIGGGVWLDFTSSSGILPVTGSTRLSH